jgi:hypothetical protein
MEHGSQPATRVPKEWMTKALNLIWLVLPLLGFLFFLYRNTHESVWVDEAYTLGISSRSMSLVDLWRYAAKDYHPPLYYALLWLFRWVFGPSVFVARAFSALAAFGLLLLGAYPFRRACGNAAALILMALAVVAPAYAAYAQDVRMYSMAAFAVFGMAVYLHLAIRDGRRADWVKAFLFTLLAMYVHIYALLGAVFVGLYSLAYAFLVHRRRTVACVSLLAVSAVAFLPWVFVLYGQFQRASERFWIPPLTRLGMMEAIVFPFGLKFESPDVAAVTVASLLIACVVGIFVAMRRRRTYALAAVCLSAFFSTTALMFLVSWRVRPLVIGRYMLPLTGLLLAAAAFGLAQLHRAFVLAVGVIILAFEIPLIRAVYSCRYNGPMTEVAEYVEAYLRPGDVFVHTEEHSMVCFAYYFPDNTNIIYLTPDSEIYMDPTVFPNGRAVADLDELSLGDSRVWITRRANGGNYSAYLDVTTRFGRPAVPEGWWGMDFGPAKNFSLPLSWSSYFVDASPSLATSIDTIPPAGPGTSEPSSPPSEGMLEELQRAFSAASIQSQDDFEDVESGAMPQGWSASAPDSLQVNADGQLLVQAGGSWTVFYYDAEMLVPQKGVAFSFRYSGVSETFTLGIDAATPSGEKIPAGPGFYSIALKMEYSTLTAHSQLQNEPEDPQGFQGELTLEEGSWYRVALAFDSEGQYVIYIWQPGDYESHLAYSRDCGGFPTTYYFVGYLSGDRTLRLDDYTVFLFEDIL